MKTTTPRRAFLQRGILTAVGVSLVSGNAFSMIFNECPFEGYNPFSEEKWDLRTTLFGEHVQIEGKIYDDSGKQPLSNAIVEMWHLSPNSSKYRHHGKITTSEDGSYKFITDLPERREQITASIYFKVSHSGREAFTELRLGQKDSYITSEHWQKNQKLGTKLFPTREIFLNKSTINFNFSLTN